MTLDNESQLKNLVSDVLNQAKKMGRSDGIDNTIFFYRVTEMLFDNVSILLLEYK